MARAKPDTVWFRTGSRNEAFTLAYGTMRAMDWDFGPEEDLPENALPCCWKDEIVDRLASTGAYVKPADDTESEMGSIALFDGNCFYVIHSGDYSEMSHHFTFKDGRFGKPLKDDLYGSSLKGVDELDETKAVRTALWEKYLSDGTDIYSCILAETYAEFISPDVLKELEAKFHLSGGTWFMLPSDCYTCS